MEEDNPFLVRMNLSPRLEKEMKKNLAGYEREEIEWGKKLAEALRREFTPEEI